MHAETWQGVCRSALLSSAATLAAGAEAEGRIAPMDELWLVIDVDDRAGALDAITAAAEEQGFRTAVSNPCIELWLLLHHTDDIAGIASCRDCDERLRQKLGVYKKAKLDTAPYTKPAIQRAVARARDLDGDGTSRWPAAVGSHVYRLLDALFASE